MREIKFRLWCSHKKEWEKDAWCVRRFGGVEELKSGQIMRPDTHTLEQFTGLLDKNGKEIYEGDILMRDSECVCAVKYKTVNGRFEAQGKVHTIHAHKFKLVKVVGNIHKNPELLEGGV